MSDLGAHTLARMSLLVTGTIGIDTLHAPTGEASGVLGGSCAYFAAAASQLTPVRVVGAVGGDWPAAHERQLRAFRNICLDGLERRANSQTFAWGGRYFDNMNRRETLFTRLGVLEEAPPKVPAKYLDSRTVFLANSHPLVQLDLLRQFKDRPFAVCDTMDLWIKSARADLDALLKQIDGLVLNYDEAEMYTGKKNPVTAARLLQKEHDLKFVIVKKGEHGCLIVHKDGVAALPAYPAEEVIDPTGAGDTFAGGMMGYIASQAASGPGGVKVKNVGSFEIIQQAVAHGTVMASFNIESFTLTRLQRLKKGELDARYKDFAKMVRV